MLMRDVWKTLDRQRRERFLARVGTTEGYVEKLCGGHCNPSLEMAARLIEADRRLTFQDFLRARKERLELEAARGRQG